MERLIQYHDRDLAVRLTLAECQLALGEEDDGERMLARLAPSNGKGYGPAHFRRAVRLLQGKPSAAQQREAAGHLLHALEDGARPCRCAALLARIYLDLGMPEAAEPHLVAAARTYPDLSLTLAALYARRGDQLRTRKAAADVRDSLAAKVRLDLDNVEVRLACAQAHVFLEQFEQAVAVLKQSLTICDDARCRSALASAYAAWSEKVIRTSPGDPRQRFRLLEEGLSLDPANGSILQSFMGLLRQTGPEADKARGICASRSSPARARPRSILYLARIAARTAKQRKGKHSSSRPSARCPKPRRWPTTWPGR